MPAMESRVALVTGAARRVGAEIARALHADGYSVVVHYLTAHRQAAALTAELSAIRANSASTIGADLAEERAVDAIMGHIDERWGRLDLLVNNASVFESTPAGTDNSDIWQRTFAINLRAPYALAIEATPLLRAVNGSIVNIIDIHARRARRNYAIYCASKAGLAGATRALALDLAPAVRVNGVSPGAVLWADNEDTRTQAEALARTPLERCGEAGDVAHAVCYLAAAKFVTGQIIDVDGGRSAQV